MQKLIIAHRGASAEAPENTLEAFKKAVDMGADMIETDVRQSKDSVLILYHNSKINKKKVKDLNYNQIRQANPRVPTLEQTLKVTAGKIKLDVEIKEPGYEQAAVRTILKYVKPEDLVITSFNAKVLSAVKKINPNIKLGILVGHKKIQDNLKVLKMVFGKVSTTADIIVINSSVWKYKLPKLYRFGQKPVYVWTVDKKDDIKKLLKDKAVSGIITNNPRLGIELRNIMQ